MPSTTTPDSTIQNRRGSLVRRVKTRDDASVPVLVRVPDFTDRKKSDTETRESGIPTSLDDPRFKTDASETSVPASGIASIAPTASPSTASSPKTQNQSEAGSVVWQFVIGGALLGFFVLAYVFLSNSEKAKSKDPNEQIPADGLEIEYPKDLRAPNTEENGIADEKANDSSNGNYPQAGKNQELPTPAEFSPVENGSNGSYPTTDYPPVYQPLDGQQQNTSELPDSAHTQPPPDGRRASLTGTIKAPPPPERK